MTITIRPFIKSDRDLIRQICCDVANRGGPIEDIFPDRQWAADLLTGYYTDYEPASTIVYVCDDLVVGYVQGCLDNRRYGLVMLFIVIPKALIKGLKKGVFFKADFWRFASVMLRNWPRLFAWRKESFHSHQAHMHIGIRKDFQGRHVGRQLMSALLEYVKSQGVDELTASVHDGNASACGFFEHLGFKARERYEMFMAKDKGVERYHSILYVKKII